MIQLLKTWMGDVLASASKRLITLVPKVAGPAWGLAFRWLHPGQVRAGRLLRLHAHY